MSDSPWFPLYVGDFVSATHHMEPELVGVYVRLLCLQWTAGRIPVEDNRALCRAAGLFPDELGKYAEFIAKKFPGGINPRLQKEKENREKQRRNGSKGGRPKNPKETQTITQTITQPEPKSKASQLQLQSQKEREKKPILAGPVDRVLAAAGFNRGCESLSPQEFQNFGNWAHLLTDPDALKAIEENAPKWIREQNEWRKTPVSISSLSRSLGDVFDFKAAKTNGHAKPLPRL